jgi:cytochrome c-type biogenesis protein CcsB
MFTHRINRQSTLLPIRVRPCVATQGYGVLVLAFLLILTTFASAIDQAMPADHPSLAPSAPAPHQGMFAAEDAPAIVAQDRTAFRQQIKLDDFHLLAISDQSGQVKTVDTWARQTLKKITNHETWEGQDPVYTVLDMMIRPEAWSNEKIVFVQAIPIRQQLTRFAQGDTPKARDDEALHMMQTGLVSPAFLERTEVQQLLERIASSDNRLNDSVNKVLIGQNALDRIFFDITIAPPAAANRGAPWHLPVDFAANIISPEERAKRGVEPVPGYTNEQALRISLGFRQLILGWRQNDVATANSGIQALNTVLPTIDPQGYPSHLKRVVELWYNRTFYGTVLNVFLYFISMTLFLLVAVGAAPKLRGWAFGIFTVAVILHIVSMGIRMWLAGRWPTQNQFESVLGSALLGCVLGWFLENWQRNGLFGMAFSFVGFLAMTACMAAPYMFGTDLGGAISKTAGILQTYWLYIHVNIVIASYALISASFVLGLVYLLLKQWHWINPLEPGSDTPPSNGGPGTPVLAGAALSTQAIRQIETQRALTLTTLDQANMVILQMAFWFLGIGIICGAVWADHSWGRPWGWDPKETFALITWIVYLIIVHVRIVAPKAKQTTTAWLSVAGFAVMMFNWIGVNFFLAGLHSYA